MSTRVNVGLNRVVKRGERKLTEHKNVRLEIAADWDSDACHTEVRETIAEWYPEWAITGYAPQQPALPVTSSSGPEAA